MEEAITLCEGQFRAIGRALDRYEREHGEPPAYLSDLVPDYLPDATVFHCPADPSPGSPRSSGLPADPHRPISYFYELNPEKVQPIGVQLGPEPPGADASWRELKLAQRVHFGDRVPVVTCTHHNGVRLHLTPAGAVYRSRGAWEDEPATIAAAIERLAGDLAALGPTSIQRWSHRRSTGTPGAGSTRRFLPRSVTGWVRWPFGCGTRSGGCRSTFRARPGFSPVVSSAVLDSPVRR